MIIFTVADADGQMHEIAPGGAFTTHTQRVDTPEEAAYSMTPVGEFARVEIRHGDRALYDYSDDTLARFGIVKTEVADPPPPPPPFPEAISRMQLRRQVLTMDRTDGQTSPGKLRDQIDAGIAASGDLDLIEYWNATSDFHRHHPKVVAMLAAFSITEDQADAAWITAAQLS